MNRTCTLPGLTGRREAFDEIGMRSRCRSRILDRAGRNKADGVDGKTALLGIVLAYEVCGQLVDHATLRANGWDHPIYHSIATALAAGRILGLSRAQLANAIGLAVVAKICLRETRTGHLSNWKGFAGPNGSRSGLYAALLAQEGIAGPPHPCEGKAGFMKQLNTRFALAVMGGGQVPFRVEGTFFKYIPVRYELQLPILVAIEIRGRFNFSQAVSIRVHVEKKNALDRAQHPEPWNPPIRATADHSGPYLIGAALVDGGISDKAFKPERYRAPEILELIQKISMVEDPQYTAEFPRSFNCRFEVRLKSGELITIHRTNPTGHPANPMSDQELEAKFLKLVDYLIPQAQSKKILHTLWNLERMNNIGGLFPLMLVAD